MEEDSISRLLAGEGTVGRYGELLKLGRRGDNLTPHHVPSNAYMVAKVSGYTRNMGIAIMMEHPVPGAGGSPSANAFLWAVSRFEPFA